MQDQLLERLAALGHDEQSTCLPAGDERLLDGSSAGDQLVGLGIQQIQ